MMGTEQLVDLYRTERGALKRTAARVVGEHQAEDLVQEAFLTYLASPPWVNRPGAWLSRVTRNRALNEVRRRREVPLDDRITSEAPPALSPAERAAVRAVLEEAFAALPERSRVAIQSRYLEGCSYEDVAAILNVKVEQAHVVVHRSVRQLGKHLVHRFAASHGALSCAPALERMLAGGNRIAGEHAAHPCEKCRPAWDELAALRSLGLTMPGGLLPLWLRRLFTELPVRVPVLTEAGSGFAAALLVFGLSTSPSLAGEPASAAPARPVAISAPGEPVDQISKVVEKELEQTPTKRLRHVPAAVETVEAMTPSPIAEAGPVKATTEDSHAAVEAEGDEGSEGGLLVCRPLKPCPPPPSS